MFFLLLRAGQRGLALKQCSCVIRESWLSWGVQVHGEGKGIISLMLPLPSAACLLAYVVCLCAVRVPQLSSSFWTLQASSYWASALWFINHSGDLWITTAVSTLSRVSGKDLYLDWCLLGRKRVECICKDQSRRIVWEGIAKLSGKLRKGATLWDIDWFWEFCL